MTYLLEGSSVFASLDSHRVLSSAALIDLAREVIKRKRLFRFAANGKSMAPFIKDGDVITLAPLGQSPASVGKVVAFQCPGTGTLTVHRVIDETRTGFLIKGDNTPGASDGIIPRNAVLGTVVKIERDGRSIHWGLGPERRLIALLSKYDVLTALTRTLRKWKALFSAKTQA